MENDLIFLWQVGVFMVTFSIEIVLYIKLINKQDDLL